MRLLYNGRKFSISYESHERDLLIDKFAKLGLEVYISDNLFGKYVIKQAYRDRGDMLMRYVSDKLRSKYNIINDINSTITYYDVYDDEATVTVNLAILRALDFDIEASLSSLELDAIEDVVVDIISNLFSYRDEREIILKVIEV